MRRTTLLWLLLVGCGRCGGESAAPPGQALAEAPRCDRLTAIPMDREAQTFGLTLTECSDGETRTLSCQQPVTNFPAECTCPGGDTFAMIPMEFLPDDVPLWKLPGTRMGLWERIVQELVAGDGEQARAVVAARCDLAIADAPRPAPVLAWLWDLPREDAESALEAAFGRLPERRVRDADDVAFTWDEVRGPSRLVLAARDDVETGAPCRYAGGEGQEIEGRCHLVAPNVLELRPTTPPASDAAPSLLRLGLDPVDGLRVRIARLGPAPEPADFVRRLPLTVSGRLTAQEVEEARGSFEGSIAACRAAYEGAPVTGFVALQFVVAADGRTGNAGVRTSSLGAPNVEACLREAVAGWRFPEKPAVTNVTVPIELTLP